MTECTLYLEINCDATQASDIFNQTCQAHCIAKQQRAE